MMAYTRRTHAREHLGLIAGLFIVFPSAVRPQDTPSPPRPSSPTAAAPAPALPHLDDVRVIRVVKLTSQGLPERGQASAADTTPMALRDSVHVHMNDIISLQVRDLQALANRADCLSRDGTTVPGCKGRRIVLYLDGRAISDLVPESGAPRPKDRYGTLQFHLARTATADEAWADLLGGPGLRNPFYRPLELSTGLEGEYPVDTDVTGRRFIFDRIRPVHFAVASIVAPLFLFWFIRYARRRDVLRDSGRRPDGGQRKPYSLGRCQMAWWFFLVVGAFAYIYIVTNSSDTITGSTLALIGISATTFLGAAAIDSDGRKQGEVSLHEDEEQGKSLRNQIATLKAQIADPATPTSEKNQLGGQLVAKETELAAIDKRLREGARGEDPEPSTGFLNDILNDTHGHSFHRLQMVVWTLVLSVLFIIQVWNRLSMPTFDATLLGLMGISSGTYLGFKFPERET